MRTSHLFTMFTIFLFFLLTACAPTSVAFNINFDSNQGSPVESVFYNGIGSFTIPENPSRDGYTFDGWFLDNMSYEIPFTVSSLLDVPIQSDIGLTVYAKWVPIDYQITYILDDGTNHENNPYLFNLETTSLELNDPEKEGHTFDGWYLDQEFDISYDFSILPLEDITIYAKWNINSYTLQFINDDNTLIQTFDFEYGFDISGITLPTTSKVGYTFKDWDISIPDVMPAANLTLRAQYTINQYTIDFETNGGSEIDLMTVDYASTVTKPVDPTKVGHIFVGWYTDQNLNTPYVFTTAPGEDLTIYAKWDINQYTFSFESNGGSLVDDIIQDFASIVLSPSDPLKPGYTFNGWYIDIELTDLYTFTIVPATNIALYAKWSPNLYEVTFVLNNNEGNVVETDFAGSELLTPKYLGYIFDGWYIDQELNNSYTFSTFPIENMILYAKWSLIVYTVNYELYGGVNNAANPEVFSVISENFTYLNPIKEGYSFLGWYENSEFEDEPITEILLGTTGNINMYAKWSINTYILQFTDEDNTTLQTYDIVYGSDLGEIIVPTASKIGHSFNGWDTILSETMPASDLTLKAQYIINQYTITFESFEGSSVAAITQDYLTTVIAPVEPSRVAYLFDGWYIDDQFNVPYIFTTMPDGDLTLFAKWERNVDLYPYDQIACLESTASCTQVKLGDSNWDFIYYGYIYHVVRGSTRYVTEWDDDNSDGFISALEMTVLSWNAFASLIINDTDESVVLTTNNARSDLTSVIHRIYTYFDQNGKLQMFEDHISKYYIFNDGTDATPANADWRLATEAEITAYDAADPKPATTRLTHIRMKLDSTDSNGYKIEPLKYLTWTNADVDTAVDTDVENWSTILTGNPNFVTIPAGWTVFSFGTNDRGTLNIKTRDYINSMPQAMTDDKVKPMRFIYTPQPAVFSGLTALDEDIVNPGISIVLDLNSTFELSQSITATWINMFNAQGKIINSTEKLSYEVIISKDGVNLETITYTYDKITDLYISNIPITSIDSSVFGDRYEILFRSITPFGDVREEFVEVVVGELTPSINGVSDRYISTAVDLDLLKGITIVDRHGINLINNINVTLPAGLDINNLVQGEYLIQLELSYDVTINSVNYPIYTTDSYILTVVDSDLLIDVDTPVFLGVNDKTQSIDDEILLLDGILAFDEAGKDVTQSMIVTKPDTLDLVNAQVGSYLINLMIESTIRIQVIESSVDIKGTIVSFDEELYYNKPIAINTDIAMLKVWSDADIFRNVTSGYGSVIIIIATDGTMKERYDRYNWNYTTSSGTVTSDLSSFSTWQANLVLLPGEYIVAGHGSVSTPPLRASNLSFGDSIMVTLGYKESHVISISAQYTLTIIE